MKIVTWNVNSVRTRIEHIKKLIDTLSPDVICLQETKVQDKDFPEKTFKDVGYYSVFSGQKSYNGVAILSRHSFKNYKADLFDTNGQKRTMEIMINDTTFINAYFPRGGERGEEAYFFKLEFYQKMKDYLEKHFLPSEKIILCGDFNVARTEKDVWNPELLQNAVGFMKEERAALENLLGFGLIDLFREFHTEKAFSWWDYRMGAFKRNMGMRIDYILVSKRVRELSEECTIHKSFRALKKPSDHAPLSANIKLF